jgi:hypothetical protein
MERRRLNLSIKILIALLVLSIPLEAVLAVSKTGSQRYLDFWEGIDAYAWKKAETNGSDTLFRGRIRSYTVGGTIHRIGWDWWSVQQWCGTTPWSSHNYGGHAQYDSSNAASTSPYFNIYYCGSRKEKVNGQHDFKHGPRLWEPNFTVTMNLP